MSDHFTLTLAQDVSNMCYGLAALGLGHHRVWTEALLPRAAQVAPLFEPQSLRSV